MNISQEKYVKSIFSKSIAVKEKILKSNQINKIVLMSQIISNSILNGGKLLICGNGGSAADAQHLAAELLIRLRPNINRKSYPAISLAQDTSTITACGNDYSFDDIFKRALEGIGNKGDCLLCISTSGNSKNILKAIKQAKKQKLDVFCFLGSGGGKAKLLSKINFIVPSKITGRIQESHITAGHCLMELIENKLLNEKN